MIIYDLKQIVGTEKGTFSNSQILTAFVWNNDEKIQKCIFQPPHNEVKLVLNIKDTRSKKRTFPQIYSGPFPS